MRTNSTLRVTDTLKKKAIEIPCSLSDGMGFETRFNNFVRSKRIREQIIDGLHLYFGDAKLELVVDGQVIGIGKFEFNAFSGRGNVETRRCTPYQA